MNRDSNVIIIGGGLAGLTSAIHLSKQGINTILIEQDTYPKHKVCGEYISNEVLPYFDFLDIDIQTINPVNISKFTISTQKGKAINSHLPLGGFGVSRYTLDHYLATIAKENGVQVLHEEVVSIAYKNDTFYVKTSDQNTLLSTYVVGAFGKRSIIDKLLKRDFSFKKSPWLAVKSHYNADFDKNTVALHNFKGGYCGLSKVENEVVNACYLVHYDSFKKYKNIDVFQDKVMCKNQYLYDFFKTAKPIFDKPLTISQVNFDKKKPVEDHIFMVGDSAGLIHPLCGNGMAMAIQSAQIICELLITNKQNSNKLSRAQIEQQYAKQWKAAFAKRLYTGRLLQGILLNPSLQQVAYFMADMMPAVVPKIIKQTHGEPLVC